MFAEGEPPECYWLPRPYSEEDQAEVSQVAQSDKVEFVPWASLRRLADGMASARNQKIPILATEGDPADDLPSLAGWAAAVGAKNVLTGEAAPAPPAEIQKTLGMLKMYGNNGWSDFKTNVGTMTRTHGKILADAGYPVDWVVGYFIGQGLDRHSRSGCENSSANS